MNTNDKIKMEKGLKNLHEFIHDTFLYIYIHVTGNCLQGLVHVEIKMAV